MKDEQKKSLLGKLKLNQLRKSDLEQREMNALKGGVCANCACVNYGYPTGSSGNSSTGTVANY